jgi:hypothetical protein
MKKIYHYITVFIVVLGGGYSVASCSGDLVDLNNDPKTYTEAKPGALFLSGQKGLADTYSSAGVSVAPFRVLSQVWTQTDYSGEARYNLLSVNSSAGWWKQLYTTSLINFKHAKAQYIKDTEDTDVLKNALAIIDILEVYNYYLLVNTYGDIPYTEALQDNTPFPKYDDAKTIVLDLINRLDAAISNLDINHASVGNADQIYAGDVAKWRKFAATLKLKAALLIYSVEPQLAKTKAEQAIAAGILESNSDNALFKYDGAVTGNSNNVWYTLVFSTRRDYSPTQFFIDRLEQANDPRLGLLFAKDISDGYSGGKAGEGNDYTALSPLSATWLTQTRPVNLLDYAEAEFLLAEALERGITVSGTAKEHYENAIKASIVYWGGDATTADNYVSTEPAIQYASANWKEKIGYQRWIAFADRAWDAWTEIRRLGHPDIDALSPPTGAESNLPQRLIYPTAEENSNSANWTNAAAKITGGHDVVSATLFWHE